MYPFVIFCVFCRFGTCSGGEKILDVALICISSRAGVLSRFFFCFVSLFRSLTSTPMLSYSFRTPLPMRRLRPSASGQLTGYLTARGQASEHQRCNRGSRLSRHAEYSPLIAKANSTWKISLTSGANTVDVFVSFLHVCVDAGVHARVCVSFYVSKSINLEGNSV